MLAAYGGHEDVVAALIIAGADVTGLENNKGQKAEDLVGISSLMRDCLRRWQSFIERKKLEELERVIERAAAAGRREDDHIAFLGSGLEHALVSQETALLPSFFLMQNSFVTSLLNAVHGLQGHAIADSGRERSASRSAALHRLRRAAIANLRAHGHPCGRNEVRDGGEVRPDLKDARRRAAKDAAKILLDRMYSNH